MAQNGTLQATIEQHDRFQVELKVSYPLSETPRRRSHEVDLYFFSPRSLGVRRDNYSKADFYDDLQSYIRLTTPAVPLDCFADGPQSPIAKLRSEIERTEFRNTGESPHSYERAVKLFCSMLKSAVRDFASYTLGADDSDDRARLVAVFVRSLRSVCHEFRALRPEVLLPGVGEQARSLYLFADEWLSLLVEVRSYRLLEGLKCAAGSEEVSAELLALVNDELQYRRKRGYPSIPDEQSDNEVLIFRRSALKKHMASILFLQTEVREEGQVLRQTLFGIAAGVAMLFATAVAFAFQSVYGALTPPFFAALVVSYIFKDRIKELLRAYFGQRLGSVLFDKKTVVYDAARRPVGVCRESFDFLDEQRIPETIRQLRDRDHITEIENGLLGEQVFVYKKRVRLKSRATRRIFPDYAVPGVTDILRFSVHDFLRRMDDPKKELFVMDDDGYQPIKGARVYHLNLILRMSENKNEELRRYRVVLSRKGIKRIEFVRGTEGSEPQRAEA